MSGAHLFVAVPAYAGVAPVTVETLLGLTDLAPREGIRITTRFLSGRSIVSKARNELVDQFLQTDATHLLFLDADIGIAPTELVRLLRMDLDLVGVAYPLKSAVPLFVVQFDDPNAVQIQTTPHGRHAEAKRIGTGVMLVRRNVFARLDEHFGDAIRYVDWDGAMRSAYFDFNLDTRSREYVSEDWVFCDRWRALGGRVHVALDARVTHMGSQGYSGTLSSLVLVHPDDAARGRLMTFGQQMRHDQEPDR